MAIEQGVTERYREVVRIAELADERGAVSDHRFIDCEIIGPAVLVPIRDVHLSDIVLDVPSVDAAFIELADDAPLVGMIPLFNVDIVRCRMRLVGVGGTAASLLMMRGV